MKKRKIKRRRISIEKNKLNSTLGGGRNHQFLKNYVIENKINTFHNFGHF